jgi:HSP20 family protein
VHRRSLGGGETGEKEDGMTSLMPRSFVFPDLFRMLEGGWPFGDHHAVRIEDFQEDGKYVVRAELPGMDPDKDIHISVQGNELSITAERAVETHDKRHSEFSYGKFARTVRLPSGAVADEVVARYANGVLEVTVPLRQEDKAKQIEVTIGR